MVTVTEQKTIRKSRVKYAGITEAARRLKVTRQHLYLVLEKKRLSRPLMKRYCALKRQQIRSRLAEMGYKPEKEARR